MVNSVPEATLELAEPMVCAMLASRMCAGRVSERIAVKKATVMTATGIDVEMVRPTRRPR